MKELFCKKNLKVFYAIIAFAFAMLSTFSCKYEKVEPIGNATNESESKTNDEKIQEKEETQNISAVDIDKERKMSLDKANIIEEVVDISDVEGDIVYQDIKYGKLSLKSGVSNENIEKALSQINEKLKTAAEEFKNEHKDEIRENQMLDSSMREWKYSYDSTDLFVTNIDDKYFSVRNFTYTDLMGAHPSYYIEGFNFDIETGKELKLIDMINDKEELRNYLFDWCEKNKEEGGLFDEYKETINNYLDNMEEYTLEYYIEDGKMNLVFQTYDIAPYAVGAIHIEVPERIRK
ncbi:MAG: DUF3298 domain-containing protein [Lachnospiraceae bacterium]|nr:DUF3298 domain-containing protein [Lachnospiraceae bacterium]